MDPSYIRGSARKFPIIFINDAPEVINNEAVPALFADNSKLYRNITSVRDCNQLQQSITNVNAWSQDKNMKFNGSKCKVLSVTRKKAPVSFPYHLGSKELLRVDDEKDLSVIVSSKLQWNLHINQIVSKANRHLGILKRTCFSLTDINIRHQALQRKFSRQLTTRNSVKGLKAFNEDGF